MLKEAPKLRYPVAGRPRTRAALPTGRLATHAAMNASSRSCRIPARSFQSQIVAGTQT